jgi:hypothetical protein
MERILHMGKNYKLRLPNDFPEELYSSAKSLEHLGISELAWGWESVIKAIKFLCERNYVILGGDVYQLINGSLKSTYDSWYINKNEVKPNNNFVEESMNKAISYINLYHEKNGTGFYYSIVFVTP